MDHGDMFVVVWHFCAQAPYFIAVLGKTISRGCPADIQPKRNDMGPLLVRLPVAVLPGLHAGPLQQHHLGLRRQRPALRRRRAAAVSVRLLPGFVKWLVWQRFCSRVPGLD